MKYDMKSELIRGLSNNQVKTRLNRDGYNELPSVSRHDFSKILLEIIAEPMFILLFACGLIYFLIGDITEALMLMSFVVIIILITLYQTQKTEKTLKALKDLSSPRALVIRDRIQQRIPGREVVQDDIVLLSEGDRVPADAFILSSTNLHIDESLLTGESVPVLKKTKTSSPITEDINYDKSSICYSGTMVVKGNAICRVMGAGQNTELGRIGKVLEILKPEKTYVQKQTAKIIRNFTIVGLTLCMILIIIHGLNTHQWLHSLIAGITMAMAILPEELPVVLTVFLALGAWRISQQKVLTRRMPAVEMLGATSVLCVDKTGTLTLNQMSVTKISIKNRIYDISLKQSSLPEDLHTIVEASILASPADPFDPMEKAMKELGIRTLNNTEHLHYDWQLLREYPLLENLMAMSRVWQSPNGKELVIAAKGAPEAIADLCHLNNNQLVELQKEINHLADYGLRVIGIAQAKFPITELPVQQHDFEFEFLGLLGLTDPVRPDIEQAIHQCHNAGIKIVMITGDYPGTALNIAKQIGLDVNKHIITGPELNQMSDLDLQTRIKTTNIFARVIPEQKLRIVNALKANQEIVAMTGDGVNDAPALKAAHIGVAMGRRGTDVAREASDLVLLDDNFTSIVASMKAGRRIFDNLKKAIGYIFAVHIPIVGMSMIPVLFKMPLALFPVHIVFLELIIDPACSIVFEMEKAESDIMQRKPRKFNEPLFNRHMIFTGLIQGLSILAIVITIYILALHIGLSADLARTLAFINLVIGNLGLIFANRSQHRFIVATLLKPNKALWWIFAGTLVILTLTLTVPFLRILFKFEPINLWQALFCLITALTAIAISETAKFPYYLRYWRRRI
ncbi:MAG: cation-translocating P-type ATPase [Candidatus Latescibacteria bacterium]|nr:cation-translocating P-type ATPase [Candidatus Latescibacterota bacterium]